MLIAFWNGVMSHLADKKFFVLSQDDNVTTFKIRVTTQMRRIFSVFAERNREDRDSLHYMYRGTQLQPTDTASSVRMVNDDLILCHRR